MTTLTATQARERLPEALNRVAYAGERVVIRRRGKVIGAIVSGDDLAALQMLDREDRYWARVGKKALTQMKGKGEKPIPWEKLKKELGL